MSPAAIRLFLSLLCLLASPPASAAEHRTRVKGPEVRRTVYNLVQSYREACRTHADRPLFLTKNRRGKFRTAVTYGEFAKLVDRFRGGLERLGVGPGDRVAIIADNGVQWAVSAYATYGRGAAFVPMYRKQHIDEWAHILADSGAKVVIVADQQTQDAIQGLQRAGKIPESKVIALHHRGRNSYAEMIGGVTGQFVRPANADTAGLIYTSGTSGAPKGVELSHDNITSNISAIRQLFPDIGPGDRSLAILPWAHAMGQNCELHGLLSAGVQIAINDTPANIKANLKKARPTLLVAVPKIFEGIHQGIVDPPPLRIPLLNPLVRKLFSSAKASAHKLAAGGRITARQQLALKTARFLVRSKLGGRLRMAVSGSAVLEPKVAEVINRMVADVYEGYGLSETSPLVAVHRPGDRELGTVGKPVPGVEVALDTSHEAANPKIGEGEVIVHGPNVMQRYFGNAEKTAEVMTPEGGLRTGDLGRFDNKGNLMITGRVNEQYKLANGEKVIPSPIEAKLGNSPLIERALVWGENRPHNTALIVPNWEALQRAVKQSGKSPTELIGGAIDATNERLTKGFERIRGFAILERGQEITVDNGLLTPVLKLKRKPVLNKHGHLLEELYQPSGAR